MRRWFILVFVVVLATAASLFYWSYSRPRSERQLLAEARTNSRQGRLCNQSGMDIAWQQAGQGYYDDAVATARSWCDRNEDINDLLLHIVVIRTENGDVAGAKAMAAGLVAPLRQPATALIADTQARYGDFAGALATAASLPDPSGTLLEIASRQVQCGDLEGAVLTAQKLDGPRAAGVYGDIGQVLYRQHLLARKRELASKIPTAAERNSFLVMVAAMDPAHIHVVGSIVATPCDLAYFKAKPEATAADFQEADRLFEEGHCGFRTTIAERQFRVDPAGAERLLLNSPDTNDRSSGIERLAELAAQQGEIPNALRLLDMARAADLSAVALRPAIRAIGRGWTLQGPQRTVLRWARSFPAGEDRAQALLGMAEAMGHARPKPPACR